MFINSHIGQEVLKLQKIMEKNTYLYMDSLEILVKIR
jgi:hypothetical protein